MHIKKVKNANLGSYISCGKRKIKVDSIEDDVADVTLLVKKGETVNVVDPRQRDNPWILDDPGDGKFMEFKTAVTVGHKIRVGNYRQFRILSTDGKSFEIAVVGPEKELN